MRRTGVRISAFWNFVIHQNFSEFLQPIRDLRIQRVAPFCRGFLLIVFGDLLAWVSSGRPDLSVNTTPQNDVFSRCKSVHKMATGKSDDELIQLDDKMRIWTRSGKFRKVENPELSMAW